MQATLLPGVYIQTVPPPVGNTLPRMDIAAFVGFAQSGPLDVPVMVEDISQFENIFGSDYTLAWDSAAGSPAIAQLGPSVRSFFRNGGVRCWVVRVAAESAVTNTFVLPCVYAWDGALKGVKVIARSAGSWSDNLVVNTVLEEDPIAIQDIALVPKSKPPRYKPALVPGQQSKLASGDLLRIVTPAGLVGLLAIGDDLATGDVFWFRQSNGTWGPAAAPALWKTGYRSSVLTFRIQVHGAGSLAMELRGLGFTPSHPRYWATLPSDRELFEILDRPEQFAAPKLRSDAANPRFPVCGQNEDLLYLPLGLPDFYNDDLAQGADPRPPDETPLQRDGLDRITKEIFLDADLIDSTVENVLDQAFYTRFQAPDPRRLKGMHALLEVDEVSLIAVPDASQRSFTRATYAPAVLGAPVLSGGPEFTWTVVDGATQYRFQSAGKTLYLGADTRFSWPPESPVCDEKYCFRVRAENDTGYGPWSNTIVLERPPEDFAICNLRPLTAPTLSRAVQLPYLVLSWDVSDADSFQIERSSDPAFALSETVLSGPGKATAPGKLSFEIWAPSTGTSYFRMRAHRGDETSPWSNTVLYSAAPNYAWQTDDTDALEDRCLDVSAALVRFCAARSDMFAVLHVPGGFTAEQTLSYQSRLLSQFQGDSRSPSFAAMYHPWIITADASSGVSGPQAPDGALLGTYAARTLAAGAWYSPANLLLKEVVAVDTPMDAKALQFFNSQLNLIHQQPAGFVSMSSETLSDDREYLEVNVRRLMILIRRLALREGMDDVFEPNDPAFRRRIQRHFDAILGDLFVRGAFAGATPQQSFRVVTDESVNKPESLDAGRFIVELRVAPSEPLDFLIVRLLQTGSQVLLSEEKAGGR